MQSLLWALHVGHHERALPCKDEIEDASECGRDSTHEIQYGEGHHRKLASLDSFGRFMDRGETLVCAGSTDGHLDEDEPEPVSVLEIDWHVGRPQVHGNDRSKRKSIDGIATCGEVLAERSTHDGHDEVVDGASMRVRKRFDARK